MPCFGSEKPDDAVPPSASHLCPLSSTTLDAPDETANARVHSDRGMGVPARPPLANTLATDRSRRRDKGHEGKPSANQTANAVPVAASAPLVSPPSTLPPGATHHNAFPTLVIHAAGRNGRQNPSIIVVGNVPNVPRLR